MTDSDLEPWSNGLGRLLEAEREPTPIDPAMADAVWAKVQASIIALPTPPSGGGSGGAGAAGSALGAKAIVPVVIAFVVGGAVGAILHAELAPPIIERVEVAAPVVTTVTATVAAQIPRVTTATKAPVRAKSTAEILGRERALVERARTALARGEAMEALGAITQARFIAPAGRLAEERDALEIQALSVLHKKDAAQNAIKRFRGRYPKSIFRPVVEATARSLEAAP